MIPSAPLVASFKLRSLQGSHNLLAIQTFYLNIFFKIIHKKVFRNVSLSNLENVIQRNLRTNRAKVCILEYLETEISKIFAWHQPWWYLCGFDMCTCLPQKTLDMPLVPLDENQFDVVRGLIKLRCFHPSASKSRAFQSDAATSDKDKQIYFMLMPRAWFNMEEFRSE